LYILGGREYMRWMKIPDYKEKELGRRWICTGSCFEIDDECM